MGLRKSSSPRIAMTFALLVALLLTLPGCSRPGSAQSTPSTDLAGHWTYVPAGGGSSLAVDLSVEADGHFTGIVRYGRGMGSTGDVSGQFSSGSLFLGGQVKPHPGSRPGFKLAGSFDGAAITLWPEDKPAQKVQLSKQQ